MKIPFADLFEKLRARFGGSIDATVAKPPAPAPVVKKTSSLSKTVLPSAARKAPPPDELQVAAGVMTKVASQTAVRAEPPLPPIVPMVPAPKPREQAPRAQRPPLDIKTERAIALRLSDVLDRLPPGMIKSPESFDAGRSILLKAAEVEKGMASGAPTVSLATIHRQAPEIFLHTPEPNDSTVVRLPFDKVLEQFMTLQVRADQVRDEFAPHLETPILQVTLEDKDRFGTSIEPLQSSPVPPVRVEPATAETLAAAEPEATPVATAKPPPARPPISLTTKPAPSLRQSPMPVTPKRVEAPKETHVPDTATDSAPATDATTKDAPVVESPKKISLELPPNGTGVPASERVPASSGPPVPTTVPPPVPPGPIPFKVPPPCNDIRPKFIRIPGVEPDEEPATPPPTAKPPAKRAESNTVSVGLLAILEELPPYQLNGSPSVVADDVRIQLPLSLVEPQLASGRVVVPARVLQKAMPQPYRHLLRSDTAETPVSLPLHEVLKRMPSAALRLRDDQEPPLVPEKVETPISAVADEDEKLLAKKDEKLPEAAAVADEEKKVLESPAATTQPEKADGENEQRLDARTVLARANALPGVGACAITFADGLNLAGNLPADLRADGLCAMAASLLQKIDNHLHEPNIGPLVGITMHAAKSLTFLRRNNIVLAALHAGGDLPSETRDKLATLVEKLSHTYSESESTHVHH